MPTALIFGIKVIPLCCLCGVSPLWSPDQSRRWPEMTRTESQARKDWAIFIYWGGECAHTAIHGDTLGGTFLCLYKSDSLWHPLDWWGQLCYGDWDWERKGLHNRVSGGCHHRKAVVQLAWEAKESLLPGNIISFAIYDKSFKKM